MSALAIFDEPLIGNLERRCMYCGAEMGRTPCVARMDGQITHGVCAGCEPRLRAQLGLASEELAS